MEVNIRKIASYTEKILKEGNESLHKPLKIATAIAVIKNPYANKPFQHDLKEFIDSHCHVLGELLAKDVVELIGGQVEAYGKGALVGTAGEIEHGSAIIHNLKFGNPMRNIVNGKSLLPSAEKRGATGASIDLAIKHKTDATIRSHHQTFEVRVPDAPLADEIVVMFAAADAGRAHARIGDLQDDKNT
ncbi:amino acid synthesis family protein [Alteribacillus sp. YIM 98480]|uniref:amino acid synthesis family protein n=1 Tax=Alteribacillus sp. YIM 98480 TaxID=2606599 RepID=UPI00131B37C4|nr:amino acid synthesis family protein [Alteribacillus sp. YIM 98480]